MSEFDNSEDEGVKTRSRKLTAEKALPQHSAETLIKIIKAYAIASNGGQDQVNYKDVASAGGLNPISVSGNNRFLVESGILISPKYGYYLPSEGAIRFARESAWDENTSKIHLRKIVANCWFGQVVIQNFTLRPNLYKSDLKKSLAIKCGASEGDSKALDFLIEFILYTGLIEINEEGILTKGDFDEIEKPSKVIENLSPLTEISTNAMDRVPNITEEYNTNKIAIVIHLHVNSFDDLTEGNALRLKQWIVSLAEKSNIEIQLDSHDSER